MLNVRYHVDRCTNDKGMIRILTHGLFSTCTESSFLLYPNNIRLRAGVYLLTRKETKKRIPLLGKAVPCSWWQILILSGPLLEVNYCLYPPCPCLIPPHTLFPPQRTFIYTQATLTYPLLLSGTLLMNFEYPNTILFTFEEFFNNNF
jgi:hypothetical protein